MIWFVVNKAFIFYRILRSLLNQIFFDELINIQQEQIQLMEEFVKLEQ